VHLVWGTDDDAAPVAGARLALGMIPDAQLEEVPGAGHLLEGALADAVRARVLALP
jgi:pimeloyl-ACP methyl ester carboxylesterase